MENNNISYSDSFAELIPYREYGLKDVSWHEGMFAGNGHIGVIESCAPLNDNLIYQNVDYVMPLREPRRVPEEVVRQLDEARQAVLRMDDTWNIHNRKRTNMYCHHPGHQLRIEMLKVAADSQRRTLFDDIEITDYERYTDLEHAVMVTKFKADGASVERKTYASEDDVVVTVIKGIKDFGIKLFIEDFESIHKFGVGKNNTVTSETRMKYSRFIKDDVIGVVAHYPSYKESELSEGGFAGVTKVLTGNGRIQTFNRMKSDMAYACVDEGAPVLKVTDTDELVLITYLDWTYKCENIEPGIVSEGHDCRIVKKCIDKIDEVIRKYSLVSDDICNNKVVNNEIGIKNAGNINVFNIEQMLEMHMTSFSAKYNRVYLELGRHNCNAVVDKASDNSILVPNIVSNEILLKKQKKQKDIIPELLERLYNNGRYGMLSCAGYTAPRLNGPGVGEWNLSWRNAYTMDANVNIQVAGMNSGNMPEAATGYMWFILRQLADWENNAAKVYGMTDALLIPVNTDGHRAMMVEYDINYPFQYWNAGASWMILPIAEYLDCYGNSKIVTQDEKIIKMYGKDTFDIKKDIYIPIVRKIYNFWKQLCSTEYFTDTNGNACYEKGKTKLKEGEKYLIIPSFSPENKPQGYKSAITANAAMDISAARDIVSKYIDIENELRESGYEMRINDAIRLESYLPDIQYDESNAVREWSMKEYKENNAHRHISHLYCAWPAYQTQHNESLADACRQAIINRNRENTGKDDTASHGWIHKALVEARLKNSDSVYDILNMLVHSDIFYTSLYTDHNTNRAKGVACTDTAFGIVGIINEMLVYSDSDTIELLPALSDKLDVGKVCGLMTRAGVRIDELEWDVSGKHVRVNMTAVRDTRFCLRLDNKVFVGNSDISKERVDREVVMKGGESINIIV